MYAFPSSYDLNAKEEGFAPPFNLSDHAPNGFLLGFFTDEVALICDLCFVLALELLSMI